MQRAGWELPEHGVLQELLLLLHESVEYLAQFVEKAAFFFAERIHITDGAAIAISQSEASEKVYWSFLRQLEHVEHFTPEVFREMMKTVNKETGVMGKDLWMPIRIALTGALHGPDLPKLAALLGKERVRQMILHIVE